MWQRVDKRWLWVSVAGLSLCAFLAFGDWSRWWGELTEGPDNAILMLLDRADKISSVLSGFTGTAALILAVRHARPAGTPRTADRARGWIRRAVEDFVDRTDESSRLRRALTDKRTRIIVVHGAAGVGKTELVHHVLRKARIVGRWHLATPALAVTADTILREVRTSATRAPQRPASVYEPPPESPNGQLEVILRSRGTRRHIIVLDAVDRLLDADDTFEDLSLDEALEVIASGPWHGVKVVLISTRFPRTASGSGGQWPEHAYGLKLDHLPLEAFREFAQRTAGDTAGMLASLDPATFGEVHRDLCGRPRLAELFDAVVAADTDTTAQSLAADVSRWAGTGDADRVGDRLRQRMTESLATTGQRRVYRAVAALGTPATDAIVTQVVNDGRAPGDQMTVTEVHEALRQLGRHVIYCDRTGWVYFLTGDEARRALNWRTEPDPVRARDDRRLQEHAAEALRRRRRDDRHGDWADPQAQLAEIDAGLRADLPDAVWRSILEMDHGADVGSPNGLFREARQIIAEQIPLRERPVNYAALGYLFHVSGDLPRAQANYRKALGMVPGNKPRWKAKVLINLAGLEWSQGSPESALTDFRRALDLAPDDPVVRAGALIGMARCQRRQGRFGKAVQHLQDALGSDGLDPYDRSRIAIRLLRLYLDQGRIRDAELMLGQVPDDTRNRRSGAALAAIYHDARADLLMAQGNLGEAFTAAHQAVKQALPAHDSVTALQARSTISMLHILTKQYPQAAREATLARRYSATGSLFVMALQVVSYRHAELPAQTRKVTADLIASAEERTSRCQGDFAAWLLLGLGRCAQALETPTAPTDTAVTAFRQAWHPGEKRADRSPPEPAPGFTGQILTLLSNLGTGDDERRRLQPAVNDLEDALTRQQHARVKTVGEN